MSVADLVVAGGAVVGAITVLAGAVAWLVRPRVDAWARSLVTVATLHTDQLAPGGDVRENTKAALERLEDLPDLKARLEEIAQHGTALSQHHEGRLAELERWRDLVDRQWGLFEQALVAILGEELHKRLSTTPTDNRS